MSEDKHISGGALVYSRLDGQLKVLVMYREKTDSWHLPKGTMRPGESLAETAKREVEEETGIKIELGEYLGKLESIINRDGKIINKETHYFTATPIGGNLTNHDSEHDRACFIDFDEVLKRLEKFSLYEMEGEVLRKFQKKLVD